MARRTATAARAHANCDARGVPDRKSQPDCGPHPRYFAILRLASCLLCNAQAFEENDVMAALQEELDAFKNISRDIAVWASGKWVLIHDGRLIDLFNSWEKASSVASSRFGRGPYLVRQIPRR